MGVPVFLNHSHLRVEKADKLTGISVDLKSAPDLFPVLAALCVLAEGESHLFGAPHLRFKESDRIGEIGRLLKVTGRPFELTDDGIRILGPVPPVAKEAAEVDPADDHRMAFAAAVLQAAGYELKIKNPEVVAKSFPEFWSLLGWQP
jgi:3-phosphoshikimate 1-carboxyvinyltransferase